MLLIVTLTRGWPAHGTALLLQAHIDGPGKMHGSFFARDCVDLLAAAVGLNLLCSCIDRSPQPHVQLTAFTSALSGLQALLEEASSACISMLPTGLGAAISRLADVDDWDLVTPTGQSGTRRRCPVNRSDERTRCSIFSFGPMPTQCSFRTLNDCLLAHVACSGGLSSRRLP